MKKQFVFAFSLLSALLTLTDPRPNTTLRGAGGCSLVPHDSAISQVNQLNNNGVYANELGRGVAARKVSGIDSHLSVGDALFVAATMDDRSVVFLLDPTTGAAFNLNPTLNPILLNIPNAAPSQYYTTIAMGDLNGDNVPDIAVGSPTTQKVYIFLSQVSTNGTLTYLQDSPNFPILLTTPPGTGRFGLSIAIGNLGGTTNEVLVGAPSGGTGQVFRFSYTGSTFNPGVAINTPNSPPLVSGDSFGQQVAFGDVAGDNAPDIIVGAIGREIGTYTDAGTVFVSPGPNFSTWLNLTSSSLTIAKGDLLGNGLAVADVNGGASDVIAATRGNSRAQVFTGPVMNGQTAPSPLSSDYTLVPDPALAGGWATTGIDVGDINGDNVADVIIGAPNASSCPSYSSQGAVYIYLSTGCSSGCLSPTRHIIQSYGGPQKNWLAFGWSAVTIPGTNFFVVGEPGREFNGVRKGQVYIYKYGN